jgi:hypothetical protein
MAYFPTYPPPISKSLAGIPLPPFTASGTIPAATTVFVLASDWLLTPQQTVDPNTIMPFQEGMELAYFYKYAVDELTVHEPFQTAGRYIFLMAFVMANGGIDFMPGAYGPAISFNVQSLGYCSQAGMATFPTHQFNSAQFETTELPLQIYWVIVNDDTIDHNLDVVNLHGYIEGAFFG